VYNKRSEEEMRAEAEAVRLRVPSAAPPQPADKSMAAGPYTSLHFFFFTST